MKQLFGHQRPLPKHVYFSIIGPLLSPIKCLIFMVVSVVRDPDPTMIRVTLLCGRVLSWRALSQLLSHHYIDIFQLLTLAQHINFSHSHFPQKIPPNRKKWGPQNEFPGITWTRVSVETLKKSWIFCNFPAHPDFGFWGPHFQRFGGKWSSYVGQCWPIALPN